ncbi:MAG: DNA polymerase III subunit gamma/tau [Lachnospiraceae bacterium]|nr:DNA polymerase III subunit gamma/tau [Lachnospiraceae bacterium]
MALYRKWRPDEFQEVKGQEHIVTTLKNQIKHNRVGHAYLFCGTRGTGKTTIARLIAKAVNCENPVDGSPCNECESCKAISAGASMNVIEIDAASNNGVDSVRQINDAVRYSPSTGKYLVYIIDEVHMLTNSAYNALLKTLEEPPEYVKFILATTDVQTIPVTVLSRCQRYDFKRISLDIIADRLEELLKREGIPATREAINYVAKAADGSMRDALSILDQCIAFNLGEEVTYDKVLEIVGSVDLDIYLSLFDAIKARDTKAALALINDAVWAGKDLSLFVNEFTTFMRDLLMLKYNVEATVDVTSENLPRLIEAGADVEDDKLISFINIMQETSGKIKYASTKRIVLEVAIIKLCTPQMRQDEGALRERLSDIEAKLEQGGTSQQVVYVTSDQLPDGANVQGATYVQQSQTTHASSAVAIAGDPVDNPDLEQEIIKNIKERYKEAELLEIKQICKAWKLVKGQVIKPVREFLNCASVVPSNTSQGTIDLFVEDKPENDLAIGYFDDRENLDDLEDKIAVITERKVHLNFRKTGRKDIQADQIRKWDLSKINFDNIEYKK